MGTKGVISSNKKITHMEKETAEYSVWVRVRQVKAKSLSDAIKQVKNAKDKSLWPYEVLESLTRDFYPKKK